MILYTSTSLIIFMTQQQLTSINNVFFEVFKKLSQSSFYQARKIAVLSPVENKPMDVSCEPDSLFSYLGIDEVTPQRKKS